MILTQIIEINVLSRLFQCHSFNVLHHLHVPNEYPQILEKPIGMTTESTTI